MVLETLTTTLSPTFRQPIFARKILQLPVEHLYGQSSNLKCLLAVLAQHKSSGPISNWRPVPMEGPKDLQMKVITTEGITTPIAGFRESSLETCEVPRYKASLSWNPQKVEDRGDESQKKKKKPTTSGNLRNPSHSIWIRNLRVSEVRLCSKFCVSCCCFRLVGGFLGYPGDMSLS